jgi:hypothetical protein
MHTCNKPTHECSEHVAGGLGKGLNASSNSKQAVECFWNVDMPLSTDGARNEIELEVETQVSWG